MEHKEYTATAKREIDFAFYPRVPRISLEVTNRCNLRCPYCANATLTRPRGGIDWGLFEKLVNECAKEGYDLAYLHGCGEPLLWDRLEDAIAFIKQRHAGKGSFGTNGTLLSPARVKKLLDAGLDSIYVSIDTLDPEIYARTRGAKLERVISNVQKMIESVPDTFEITIALMDMNEHRLTPARIDRFYEVFGRHPNVKLNPVNNLLFPSAPGDFRVSPARKNRCFEPQNYLFITCEGKASICCVDQDALHCLGSVSERSIQEVWFDTHNQTVFRNLALGILDCPSTCIERCILHQPNQQVERIPAGFALPISDAARLVVQLLANGENTAVRLVLEALVVRDPVNEALKRSLSGLSAPRPTVVAHRE